MNKLGKIFLITGIVGFAVFGCALDGERILLPTLTALGFLGLAVAGYKMIDKPQGWKDATKRLEKAIMLEDLAEQEKAEKRLETFRNWKSIKMEELPDVIYNR